MITRGRRTFVSLEAAQPHAANYGLRWRALERDSAAAAVAEASLGFISNIGTFGPEGGLRPSAGTRTETRR